ncbi:MAG: hypothetical protein ACREUA_07445, partial [Burkholderiales bacterium]
MVNMKGKKEKKEGRGGGLLKGLLVAIVVLVAILIALPFIVPLNFLVPEMEKLAGEVFQQPVSIASVRASLTPYPHLALQEVSIGKMRDTKIDSIRVVPDPASLGQDIKVLREVQLSGVRFNQNTLSTLRVWRKPNDPPHTIFIGKFSLEDARLKLDSGTEIGPFSATLDLNDEQGFESANITTGDGKFQIAITPLQNAFLFDISVSNWLFPVGPKAMISSLSAKARLDGERMALEHIEVQLYGG